MSEPNNRVVVPLAMETTSQEILARIGNPMEGADSVMDALKLINDKPSGGVRAIDYEVDPIIWDSANLISNGADFLTQTPGSYNYTVACMYNGYIYFTAAATTNPSEFWQFHIATGLYERLPDCPAAMRYSRAAVYNDEIYYLGSNNPSNGFWKYNIASRTWITLASPILGNARSSSMGFINGILYVAGMGTNPNCLCSYDPATNMWNAPGDLANTTACYHDGYIYLPVNSATTPSEYWRFNTTTGRYQKLENCPTSMRYSRAAVYNDEIYYLGSNTLLNGFWKYNISTNMWTALASHPLSSAITSSIGFINGILYVAGAAKTPNQTYAYNPSLNQWSGALGATGATIATNGTGIVYNNELYIFHANTAGHTQKYTPAEQWDAPGTWTALANSSSTNIGGTAVLIGEYVYVVGPTTTARRYHLVDNKWQALSSLTIGSMANGCVISDGQSIYAINPANYLYGIIRLAAGTALTFDNPSDWPAALPIPGIAIATDGTGVVYNDELYIFHNNSTGYNRKFNPATGVWTALATPSATNTGGWANLANNDYIIVTGPGSTRRRYCVSTNKWEELTVLTGTNAMTNACAVGDAENTYLINNVNHRERIARMNVDGSIEMTEVESPWRAPAANDVAVGYNPESDKLYFFGGVPATTTGIIRVAQRQVSSYHIPTGKWEHETTQVYTDDFTNSSVYLHNGEFWLFGGSSSAQRNMIRKYNIASKEWSYYTYALSWERPAIVPFTDPDTVLILGGSYSNQIAVYNLSTQVQTRLNDLPFNASHASAQKIGDRIYVMMAAGAWFLDMPTMSWVQDRTVNYDVNLGGQKNSAYIDNCMVCSISNSLVFYDPEYRRHWREAAPSPALYLAYVFTGRDGKLYAASPNASGLSMAVYKIDQGEMQRPGSKPVILGEVNAGQTVFYERRSDSVYLEVNGTELPEGKSVAPSSGFLKVGFKRFTRNNFIRGWIG